MTPTINFAAKLAQLPHYEGGMDLERARRTYEASDVIKLASNESPWGPHPAVLEAVTQAAAQANRYPDQYAALLRARNPDTQVYGITGSEPEAVVARAHVAQCWVTDLEGGLPADRAPAVCVAAAACAGSRVGCGVAVLAGGWASVCA